MDRSAVIEVWAQARARLDGLPGGRGLNIAHEAVDRHATSHRADHVALRWLPRTGGHHDITYRQLAADTSRFAALLHERAGPTATVATLLARVP